MFTRLRKIHLSAFLTFMSLSMTGSDLMAADCCDNSGCNRFYIGGFGGGIYSDSTEFTQMGTAYFTEAQGGPLAVLAEGRTKCSGTGFGGVQLGYEWSQCPWQLSCSNWSVAPAAEIEAYFFGHNKSGHLINDTNRLPEHDFFNSFHMNVRILMANAVFSFNNPCFCKFTPYVGGGLGAARISLNNADSLQLSPIEPGVNHFNSKRNDSCWAFGAQVKAGLRYLICKSLNFFVEYRYVFVDSSNYIFGSTVYSDHAPTSPWNVKIKNITYNAFAVGLQYDL